MEVWVGEDKIIKMIVKAGDEAYAKELIRFMYTEEVPFSGGECILEALTPASPIHKFGSLRMVNIFSGEDIIKLLLLANEFLVPFCEKQCIQLLLEVRDFCRTVSCLFPDLSWPGMVSHGFSFLGPCRGR